jgi:hypothetical protein
MPVVAVVVRIPVQVRAELQEVVALGAAEPLELVCHPIQVPAIQEATAPMALVVAVVALQFNLGALQLQMAVKVDQASLLLDLPLTSHQLLLDLVHRLEARVRFQLPRTQLQYSLSLQMKLSHGVCRDLILQLSQLTLQAYSLQRPKTLRPPRTQIPIMFI